MVDKNAIVLRDPAHDLKEELEHLYARRSAVDELIESLERYDRFRTPTPQPRTQKTA